MIYMMSICLRLLMALLLWLAAYQLKSETNFNNIFSQLFIWVKYMFFCKKHVDFAVYFFTIIYKVS